MDAKKEFIHWLVTTADNKYSKKEATGYLADMALAATGFGTGAVLNTAGNIAKTVPAAAFLWYFTKYIGIPTLAGYALGNSLAKSTSPSPDDLEAAENNALAKETIRRTKSLEKMPSVTAPVQEKKKDMMTRGMDNGYSLVD